MANATSAVKKAVTALPVNNSWSFQPHPARRELVVAALKEVKVAPENSDDSQLKAAVAFIEAEIAALPAEFNGVKVIAWGNTSTKGQRQMQIEVYGTTVL